ncbi:MAG: hypothetical protein ACPLVF_02015 [Thermovenabulum sp.]|uniref:hypothetical protein n=1 Tax=Thermovenabulum sp. TaxID=3100335 RepID=UPI003C7EB08F
MLSRVNNKKGFVAIWELIICSTLIVFFMFFPAVNFSLNYKKALLEDTKAIALHYAAVNGGVTMTVKNMINTELQLKGFDISKVIIESNTDDTNIKYKTDPDPMIYIKIKYPADDDVKLYKGLLKIIGYGLTELPYQGYTRWYYQVEGYIMSEKVQ